MKSKNQSWSTKELTAFVGYFPDVTKIAHSLKWNDKDRILEALCKRFSTIIAWEEGKEGIC